MDPFIRSTCEAYANVFDAYTMDDALRQEVENWKAELFELAESAADIAAFTNAFMGSGLQARYSALLSKAATAPAQADAGASSGHDSGASKGALPTVREFVEQYRPSYNEVKKAGYRKRAEKAYEEIFNVANRTDEMVEAQLIFEKERLLWNIVATDALDIYETLLEAMDPLSRHLTQPLAMLVDIYKSVGSDEGLRYKLDRYERDKAAPILREHAKIFIAALFAYRLLKYDQAKRMVWDWPGDNLVRSALLSLIALRKAIRRQVETLRSIFDMTFDDLLADQSMKIWLLAPANADAVGRIKTALHPQNYDAFREILQEEILSSKPLEEILLREPGTLVCYALDKTSGRFQAHAQEKAAHLNEGFAYFGYMQDLNSASGGFVQSAKPEIPKEWEGKNPAL